MSGIQVKQHYNSCLPTKTIKISKISLSTDFSMKIYQSLGNEFSMYKISNLDLIKSQLKELESEVNNSKLVENVPQLIDKTNVLRENEVLKKINEQKSHLLDAYLSYIDILEQLIQTTKSNTSRINHKKQTRKRKIPNRIKQKPGRVKFVKNKKTKKIVKKKKKPKRK
jgi:flagellar biosynthesis chaperone FliJ